VLGLPANPSRESEQRKSGVSQQRLSYFGLAAAMAECRAGAHQRLWRRSRRVDFDSIERTKRECLLSQRRGRIERADTARPNAIEVCFTGNQKQPAEGARVTGLPHPSTQGTYRSGLDLRDFEIRT
jgi:hypothetical protein